MSEPSIPFNLGSGDDFNNVRPWDIRDGKWGGFGESQWLRAQEHGFSKGDVAEWDYIERKPTWYRVWIEAELRWRELTPEEVARLPVLATRRRVEFEKTLDWLFPYPGTLEQAEMVAAVMSQPLLQVIEQAPVLVDVFGKKPLDTEGQVG